MSQSRSGRARSCPAKTHELTCRNNRAVHARSFTIKASLRYATSLRPAHSWLGWERWGEEAGGSGDVGVCHGHVQAT